MLKQYKKYVTLANGMTLLRIATAPIMYYLIVTHNWKFAFILCFSGGLTDLLDGFFARFYKQESLFGERFDPLADKIFMTAIYLALGHASIIPLWSIAIILGRDIIIILGALYALISKQAIPLHPLFLSKLNTVIQIALSGWLVAFQYIQEIGLASNTVEFFTNYFLYGTLLLTILSGLQYAKRFVNALLSSS
jgi:cardiolipin synthase